MKLFLFAPVFILISFFSGSVEAQVFPNPATLSTGQGSPGSLDPIWLVSSWYGAPPNPIGLAYTPALINNNCAPGSWVNPASLPPPVNNGNWITNSSYPCSSNTNAGYIYFRLPLNLPGACNGNSISSIGSYTLYLSGYSDNTISDIYVNGNSTGISGGNFSPGGQLNITLPGPWLAGMNYVDVLVWNYPNGGSANPYGLLLVANAAAVDTADSDNDGFPDVSDQCPCLSGPRANGCPPAIVGDSVMCLGGSITLWATEPGNTYLWSNGATTDTITISPVSSTPITLTVTNVNGFIDSGLVNVTVNTLPPVNINPAATGICPGGSVTLTASGGTGYVWSNAAVSTAITVSPANTSTYTVTATDANNCTASISSTVTVYPLPTPLINPSAVAICSGANTTLTASGGTSYVWSNAVTSAAITVTPGVTTPYSVTVTDANSCTASTSATVAVNPLPNAAINPATVAICLGDNTTLTATGGTSYVWSNAATSTTIMVTPNLTTTYSVTVTDANTCSATALSVVTVNPLPVPVVNPNAVAICSGGSATLTASGGVSYVWSNTGTTATITVSPAANTLYSVTVMDINTCSATASGTVTVNPLPNAVVTPATVQICEGLNATLTATGGTGYAWSNAANTAAITVSPGTTTTYSVTVTDANTCSNSASGIVTVIPTMIVSAAGTNIPCSGDNNGAIALSVVSGQGPYTYSWNNAANTAILNGLMPGAYSVVVTDNASCTATASATITEPPPLVLTLSFNNPTCVTNNYDGSITLSVTGGTLPYQYNWSNGAGGANLMNVAPGSYAVTVSDANNCQVDTAFTLAYIYDFSIQATPAPTIKLGEGTMLGYALTGNAGNLVNLWNPPAGLSCSDCPTPLASPNSTTLYQVEIKNDVGCIASDTVTVTVIPDYTLFVPNVFSPNGDGNNDLFRVNGNMEAVIFFEIKVFNRWGEIVFESNDVSFGWDGMYKGVKQEPGVFVWQLKTVFLDGHNVGVKTGSLTLVR